MFRKCYYNVFVITLLEVRNLTLRRQYGHPVNTAKFLWPVSDRINGVPLYFCLYLFIFITAIIIVSQDIYVKWPTMFFADCA